MGLYEKIKELATKKKLSIRQLEEKMEYGNGTIRRWENSKPSVDKVEKVADYFNVSVDYLLGRENEDGSNSEPVSFFRIDTTNLTEDEVNELQDELEEYQEFLKQRIKNKRNRMD
ncbi:helix-turn-helix transcriptional regulator [Vagococcus fluvialis]|uniref:helix-turn-helix domain-containing protein n=1 Tax=Vagococcus fluvialis TaxID=2738 RepID=UPI0037AAE9CB